MNFLGKIAFCVAAITSAALWAAEMNHRTDFADLPDQKSDVATSPSSPSGNSGGATTNNRLVSGPPRAVDGAAPLCEYKHPLETYWKLISIRDLQPSARQGVFFLADSKEPTEIYFQNSETSLPQKLGPWSSGTVAYRLSPDGHHIATLNKSAKGTLTLGLYDVLKNRFKPLRFEKGVTDASVLWLPKSDGFVVAASMNSSHEFSLSRYGLDSAPPMKLTQLEGYHELTDVSADGQNLILNNRRTSTDGDIVVWNMNTAKLSHPTHSGGNTLFWDGKFSADKRHLIFRSNETGTTQLYTRDLESGHKATALTSGSWDVDRYALSTDRKSLVYTTNEDGYSHLNEFELATDGNRNNLILLPDIGTGVISAIAFDIIGPNLFYSISRSNKPDQIFLTAYPKKVAWIQNSGKELRTPCLTSEQLIHYPSFDGKQIPAFFYRTNFDHRSHPTIIYAHDGPEFQYRPSFDPFVQYLLERGLDVIAPNVRGSSGYGVDYASIDDRNHRMDAIRDLVEAKTWLLANGYSDSGRVLGFGVGYGAYTISKSSEMAKGFFAAMAEINPVTDLMKFVQDSPVYLRTFTDQEFGPLSDEKGFRSLATSEPAAKKTPSLSIPSGLVTDWRYAPLPSAKQIAYFLKDYVKEKGP